LRQERTHARLHGLLRRPGWRPLGGFRMRRRHLLPVLAAAMLALAGCGDSPTGSAGAGGDAPAAGSTPVSIEAITAEAKGFNVGSMMSTRTAYVFFDPQCPHCAALWKAAA